MLYTRKRIIMEKDYVVGILSMFDNNLKLFKIKAESEYEAVKKGMLHFGNNNPHEIAWQKDPDYPKDIKGLKLAYEDFPFDVIEV